MYVGEQEENNSIKKKAISSHIFYLYPYVLYRIRKLVKPYRNFSLFFLVYYTPTPIFCTFQYIFLFFYFFFMLKWIYFIVLFFSKIYCFFKKIFKIIICVLDKKNYKKISCFLKVNYIIFYISCIMGLSVKGMFRFFR